MVQTAHDNGLVTHIMDELDTVHHLERVLYRISTLQMKVSLFPCPSLRFSRSFSLVVVSVPCMMDVHDGCL